MTCLNYTTPNSTSPLIQRKACTKNKLVYGVGINDFLTPIRIDGKIIRAYTRWTNMLKRCYADSLKKTQPTYADCTVAENWHYFSNFEAWFTENYIDGYHLDKDLLFPGNKVYSAETCVFIPQTLNNLLMDCSAARGEYPLGVNFHKGRQKYAATITVAGQGQFYLGLFTTPLEAHQAWQLAKAAAIESAEANDPRVRAAFDLRAAKLRDDRAHNRVTTKL